MWEIIVHDDRLLGNLPSGNFTPVRVNKSTPLSAMVDRVRTAAINHGGDVRLRIYCHGIEDLATGHGGLGLKLCTEDLTLGTVAALRPLNGWVSYGIDIYSCAAADVVPGYEGTSGDGRLLCGRIAAITQTVVRAATRPQIYYSFDTRRPGETVVPINFGAWEGPVLTFGPRGGNPIATQLNPAN
jgi:hypothetical protein